MLEPSTKRARTIDPIVVDGAGAEDLIEISSQEDDVCDGTSAGALPHVTILLQVALRHWRGDIPSVEPPFSIFHMQGSEIGVPRGISFYPQLVDGSFASSHGTVERNIRSILAKRKRPIFYIGSTTDLIYRWRDLRDQNGRLAGHAFARNIHWHTMLAFYRTNNGNCCALMEEALIKTFNRKAWPDGLCQNASMKALRVDKSSTATHWVYVCLPKC